MASTAERAVLPLFLSKPVHQNMMTAPYHEFVAWAVAWAVFLKEHIPAEFWRSLKDQNIDIAVDCGKVGNIEEFEHFYNTIQNRANLVKRLRYIHQFLLGKLTLAVTSREELLRKELISKYRYLYRQAKEDVNASILLDVFNRFVQPNNDWKIDMENATVKQTLTETENVKKLYEDSGHWI